jgi:uncharacterized protein
MQEVAKQKVSFQREGLKLVGNIFTPVNFERSIKYPALIVAGSVTSVKEMMPNTYAKLLAEKGFITLTFDYASYGESEGLPRQNESIQGKLKDLEGAVSYLESLPYVDKIGMVGICTSGGNAAYLAANDNRVKAVASVAGWFSEPSLAPMLFDGPEGVARHRKEAEEAKKYYELTGENKTILIFSNDTNKVAANYGPMDYYMDINRGGGIKEWKNEFAVMAWNDWMDFDPISQASKIKVPFLMIHSDGALLPEQAKKFYDLVQSEKELFWTEGYHFNFYDIAPEVIKSVDRVVSFMKKHLV